MDWGLQKTSTPNVTPLSPCSQHQNRVCEVPERPCCVLLAVRYYTSIRNSTEITWLGPRTSRDLGVRLDVAFSRGAGGGHEKGVSPGYYLFVVLPSNIH